MKTDNYTIIELNGRQHVVKLLYARRRGLPVYGIFSSKEEAREALK